MIKNSEDANKYYQLVNEFIDDYIDNHKIRPSKLGKYLRNSDKLKNFLERKGLSSIKNINRVINDVLDDRESMEKDGVLTFENFKFFESDEFKIISIRDCIWKGIEQSSILHEKMIANEFGVSLSSINVIDSEKHIFQVEDIQNDFEVIVFTEVEIQIIRENIKEYIFNKVSNKKVEIEEIPNLDINFLLNKFIDKDKLESDIDEKITISLTMNFLKWILSCDDVKGDGEFVGINPSHY